MFEKDVFSQEDFEYCKGQFKDFLEMQYPKAKSINEQIKLFCHKFCFDDLYDIQKLDKLPNEKEIRNKYIEYGVGSNSTNVWDCDDTHLARVVLFLIHADNPNNEHRIPGLNKLSDIGSGNDYRYRGDTLNTYSTLFGSRNQGYAKIFKKNMRIRYFRRKYVTIGNFILLPALSIDNESINSFRGTRKQYRDFFDLFLYKFLEQNEDFEKWRKNPYGYEYIKEYFKLVDNKNEFIKRNLLERYLNDNNEISSNIFGHTDTENPYCWWGENIDENEYRDFALGYIRKATEKINYRAREISKILQDIYK